MIELRQQVTRDRKRSPLDIDRVYWDGRLVAIVGRHDGSSAHAFKRYAESEAARLLGEINGAREAQGLFGPVEALIQPNNTKRLRKLQELARKEATDNE